MQVQAKDLHVDEGTVIGVDGHWVFVDQAAHIGSEWLVQGEHQPQQGPDVPASGWVLMETTLVIADDELVELPTGQVEWPEQVGDWQWGPQDTYLDPMVEANQQGEQ